MMLVGTKLSDRNMFCKRLEVSSHSLLRFRALARLQRRGSGGRVNDLLNIWQHLGSPSDLATSAGYQHLG